MILSSAKRSLRAVASTLLGACLAVVLVALPGTAAEPDRATIERLIPDLEQQVEAGMKAFSVPGLALGIVFDDKLIYAKGFGARRAGEAAAVTPDTVFQIGLTSKAFFATTLAQAVDAGKLKWSDAVIDHLPGFQLADPWITRDFRLLDLAAQRSGLTPYVNDGLTFLGYDKATMIRSLRTAPQTGIFRSEFRYLNIPHMVGGEIVAAANGETSWFASLKRTLLDPLGMSQTSMTPEAIEAAGNHATGHRLDDRPVPIPFHASFPYAMGPAGGLNSTIPDMAQWLRLQLGRGEFGGKVLVSEQNLDVTWTPRVSMSERLGYAMGWVVSATPRGRVIWHNGGTTGFGAHVGFLPDARTGLVILTNIGSPAMADSVAQWFYDRVLGNPAIDNVALGAAAARSQQARQRAEMAAFVAGPLPAGAAAYAGAYASPIMGTATVTLTDGRLQAVLEKTDARLLFEANRDDPSLFAVRLASEGPFAPIVAMTGDEPIATIRFEREATGRVTGFRFIDATLPHVFARQETD
jgi:CubicO group peptidase (beta-lactamase class C family)